MNIPCYEGKPHTGTERQITEDGEIIMWGGGVQRKAGTQQKHQRNTK